MWIASSDAMDVIHRAFGHIAPQRLASILRDRKLEKDLKLSDSDLRSYVDHVCDVCVRSKSSRSSHSGSLVHDKRICGTFTYDLQGPFNTP